MHIQFVEPFDAERIRRQRHAANWRQQRRQKWSKAVMYLGAVVVAIVLALFGLFEIPGRTLIGLIIFLIVVAALDWTLKRVHFRTAGQRPMFDTTVDITEVETVFAVSGRKFGYAWSMITDVEDRDGMWIARSAGGVPEFTLPRECMTPSQIAELRTFLAGRSLIPPAYEI